MNNANSYLHPCDQYTQDASYDPSIQSKFIVHRTRLLVGSACFKNSVFFLLYVSTMRGFSKKMLLALSAGKSLSSS